MFLIKDEKAVFRIVDRGVEFLSFAGEKIEGDGLLL